MNNARLSELFGGKRRFELLKALYFNPARRFTTQDLVEMTGGDSGNLSRWLNRWARLGLVKKIVSGRNVEFQAAADPLLAGLTDIVRRNDEIMQDIANALPKEVETAVVFGSVARGEEQATSDLDLLVLGEDLSEIRVNARLKPVGRKHRREINASVFSPKEFQQLLRQGNGFALGIVNQKVVPVKGVFAYGPQGAA